MEGLVEGKPKPRDDCVFDLALVVVGIGVGLGEGEGEGGLSWVSDSSSAKVGISVHK